MFLEYWAVRSSRTTTRVVRVAAHTAGVLDQPGKKALIAELSAMNAGM
jgi:hypothetical protein